MVSAYYFRDDAIVVLPIHFEVPYSGTSKFTTKDRSYRRLDAPRTSLNHYFFAA